VATAGDPDRAEAIARTITAPFQQAQALTSIAKAVAAAGDRDRAGRLVTAADAIVRTLTDPDQQAWALPSILEAVAAAGDLDCAEEIAFTITPPDQQAPVLTSIAEVAGLPRACRLLGAAFAVGSWLTPLPVLAKLRPHLVIQIAEEVYGDDRTRNASAVAEPW